VWAPGRCTMTPAEALMDCPDCVRCVRDHVTDSPSSWGICACTTCHGTGKVRSLDWLAERETDCLVQSTYGDGRCAGDCKDGKVALLPGLREPCPWCEGDSKQCRNIPQHPIDPHCQGLGYRPRQGEQAIQDAMNMAGWWVVVDQEPYGGRRCVTFTKQVGPLGNWAGDYDADTRMAAVKAIQAWQTAQEGLKCQSTLISESTWHPAPST
jgi:hypothetical protein